MSDSARDTALPKKEPEPTFRCYACGGEFIAHLRPMLSPYRKPRCRDCLAELNAETAARRSQRGR